MWAGSWGGHLPILQGEKMLSSKWVFASTSPVWNFTNYLLLQVHFSVLRNYLNSDYHCLCQDFQNLPCSILNFTHIDYIRIKHSFIPGTISSNTGLEISHDCYTISNSKKKYPITTLMEDFLLSQAFMILCILLILSWLILTLPMR